MQPPEYMLNKSAGMLVQNFGSHYVVVDSSQLLLNCECIFYLELARSDQATVYKTLTSVKG